MNDYEYKYNPIKMTPFKWFVLENFPFIEEDFDSLTSYGLWCKLKDYFDNISTKTNEMGTQVESLTNAFIALKDYVDNYFENLDVQEEINNKLDEMVQNGAFSLILSQYVNPLIDEQNTRITELRNDFYDKIQNIGNATPIPVDGVNKMTNTNRIYVNTTDGKWYYFDDGWKIGGVYQSTSLAEKSVTLDKINFERFELSNYTSYNRRLLGYNTTTYNPTFSTNDEDFIFSVDLPIENLTHDIVFPLNDMSNNIVVYYNPGVKARNLTYNEIKENQNFVYNSVNETITVKINNLKKLGYTRLAIQMTTVNHYVIFSEYDGNNISIPITKFISGKNLKDMTIENTKIKDKTIQKNKLAFDLIEFDDIVKNINAFDLSKCEYKYSYGYNTETLLPNYRDSNNFVTIIIPTTASGKIKVSKQFTLNNAPVTQLYMLNRDGKRAGNTPANEIMAKTDLPYEYSNFTVYDDYIEFNENLQRKGIYSIVLTFPVVNIPNVYIYYENSFIPDWLNVDKIAENLNIKKYYTVLNKKFKVVQNKNLLFYPQNFTRYLNTKNANLIYMTNAKQNLDNCILVKNENAGIETNKLRYRVDNTIDNNIEKNIEIETINQLAGEGLNKKVLLIGDSLTDHDIYAKKLYEIFQNDVMNITLLGTRGTSPYNEEGRSGWRAYTYCSKQYGSDESTAGGFFQGLNPFFNPSTNKFDFNYYMNNQNYNSVDYVFINLGTNDVARGNHDSENEIISYYTEMINSIKNFNANIKIGIWLPPARGIKNNISNLINRDNALRMNEMLIKNYENRENENLFLIPVNVAIDPDNDYNYTEIELSENQSVNVITDSVHPKPSGYYKIADVIYYWIKYFTTLN